MTNNFWKNRRVLITGYEGFLGSHLTRALLNHGARIWGLDIKTHRKGTILSNEDLNRLRITKGSVENLSVVSKIIKENKIAFIFHLAAEALVGKCLKNPLGAFSTNIKGAWNVLEASRNNSSIKGIIIASSDKAYGIHKELPYKEGFSLAGCHPYDVSKSCTDLIAYTCYHTYGLPIVITRCGNIFGPGDFNFSRIIPEAIRSAFQNGTLIIRSDGKYTRDYIYVDDIVRGYLMLAQKMKVSRLYGEAFNFSNEKPISVLELVKVIYKLADKRPNYRILNQAKYEIRDQYLSSKKARRILGWKPEFDIEEGLNKTIEWYRDEAL